MVRLRSPRARAASLRAPSVLALLVLIVFVSAASAEAAVSRLRVEWSAAQQQDHSPYVNVFIDGTTGGQYAGPCDARDQNCLARPGFHWEEGNFDSRGFAHLISYVDDQPERPHRVCVELQHPYDMTFPFAATMQLTVTLTDRDGSSRTLQFTLDPGQRSAVECTPAARPPQWSGGSTAPPSWWLSATRVLRSRGGKCEQSVAEREGRDPDTGRAAGTYREEFTVCRAPIPKAVFVAF